MLCARCQGELGIAASAPPRTSVSPRTIETERTARELLARWSSQNLLDEVTRQHASTQPTSVVQPNEQLTAAPRRELRFDVPTAGTPAPSNQFVTSFKDAQAEIAATSTGTVRSEPTENRQVETPIAAAKPIRQSPTAESNTDSNFQPVGNNTKVEAAHVDQPHLHDGVIPATKRKYAWAAFASQLCAYFGVGMLTCGTVLVMWSYFGGPNNFMPTGWLVAAVGQMLLLLGVVSLIACGMEQTVADLTERIDGVYFEITEIAGYLERVERRLDQIRDRSTSTSEDHDDRRRAA
jgi:hypothetical protein